MLVAVSIAAPILAILETACSARAAPPAAEPSQRHLQPVPAAARPDFTLDRLDGESLALRGQAGRVVLVHFFATWCEPCRDELASLTQLTRGRLGPRVTVLAVDVAEVPVRVRRFLETAPVPFPVLLDTDRTTSRAWGVSVLPTTFVLDRDLRPRLWVEGDLDWTRADIRSALEAIDVETPSAPPQPPQSQRK